MDNTMPQGTTRGQGPEWEVKVRELASQVDRCVDCGAAMALLQSQGWRRGECDTLPYTESWVAPLGSPTNASIAFDLVRMEYGTKDRWAAGRIQQTRWKLSPNTIPSKIGA